MRTKRLVHAWNWKKRLRVIRVELGVYDTWVNAVIGPEKHLEAFVRWNCSQPAFTHELGGAKGLCIKLPKYAPCIWVPKKPRTPQELATLAHECTHAAIYVAEWMSAPIDADTSELLCHTVSWLMEVILEHA